MSKRQKQAQTSSEHRKLKKELIDWCLDLGYIDLAARIRSAPVSILREIVDQDVDEATDFLTLMGY